MPTVKKVTGNLVVIRGAGRFERGDQADVDDELAEHLLENRDDFELVDDPPEDVEDDGTVPVIANDSTVDEIKDVIEDIEDADAVRYILDDEKDGENRTTAVDALEDRLAELEE